MGSSTSSSVKSSPPPPPPPSEDSTTDKKKEEPVKEIKETNIQPTEENSVKNDAEVKNIQDAADRSLIVGKIQREKTTFKSVEIPEYDESDEIIWETFYHQNGEAYVCMYQSGERYILNVTTQEKMRFPRKWYKEGLIVTEDSKLNYASADVSSVEDDRAGFIMHLAKGKIQTYMMEEKHYVHCYFDKNNGTWVRLPMSWELMSETVTSLMKPILETLPDWNDPFDILALLRSHNYNPQLCISTFFTWGDMRHWYVRDKMGLLSIEDDFGEKNEQELKSLNEQLESTTKSLNEEKVLRQKVEKQAEDLKETLTNVTVENHALQAKCDALQRNRPKTSVAKKGSFPVEKKTLKNLESCVKVLHKNQKQVEEEFKSTMVHWKSEIAEVLSAVHKMKFNDSQLAVELEEMKNLYRKEALQRKLLYNELQDLRGNIRVFCRCRFDNRSGCCLKFPSDTEVAAPNGNKAYTFDKVFMPQSTQEEVFEDTRPIITSCVDGYNVCILAYGQTGSGKTFTMQGPPSDPGVNVRSLTELLNICKSRENVIYELKASMVEIYNETIHDLLSPNIEILEIRTQGNKVFLQGVTEKNVECVEDIDKIMELGNKNRSVASTKMNSQSSRSHLIFKVTVTGQDKSTGTRSIGSLTLCDLAGSERVGKTEATGQRLVEAAAINKSLSSLGQVFTALRTGQLHIPYRNSKLTHILQPSLGGDAKACLFVMISPDASNLSETLSTIQFGSNAQQVQLGQAKKTVVKAGH